MSAGRAPPGCDRWRGIAVEADRLREVFTAKWAHRPLLAEGAIGRQVLVLLIQPEVACAAADDLAQAVEEAFPQHLDAEGVLSSPGLGVQLGARVLAEVGDDHGCFADACGLKAHAGLSAITCASGIRTSITRRRIEYD
ncbi:transposase [Streptomyces sp. MST-110588]|uniref:transposase n=1 Tax=Streptomyces sp. MST-110588 TaxID=2833628 RepID=UPI001F5D87CB|nr:transposase [Streptomyces sp. MST-110588]